MMEETHRAVPLDGVEAVAVACSRCAAVFRFPLPDLAEAFAARDGGGEHWACPHCHALVMGESAGSAGGPFRRLLAALDLLQRLRDRIEVRLIFRRPHGGEGGGP
jgi:hypothetical protein